ncbi:hypothetical protein [Solidesulfovibrio sp.]|uniref:hypothetical protein n=1 Tax=Solidesulfovibrio sp. TaxID=2910990 RepID=UPI002630E06E|nr:hypothetical protein [Solidesulfovibrio sp.]
MADEFLPALAGQGGPVGRARNDRDEKGGQGQGEEKADGPRALARGGGRPARRGGYMKA